MVGQEHEMESTHEDREGWGRVVFRKTLGKQRKPENHIASCWVQPGVGKGTQKHEARSRSSEPWGECSGTQAMRDGLADGGRGGDALGAQVLTPC